MDEIYPTAANVARRIIEKLSSKGQTRQCPLCGANSWTVGQYVTLQTSPQVPSLPNPFGFRPTAQNYPTVAVFCSNCGNTQLVNLLILGFDEDDLKALSLHPYAPYG